MSSAFSKKPKDAPRRRQDLRDELQYLGQMASTETALFHEKAAEYYGMGITDLKTLSTLIQEGPMTAGQLAQRLSLTTGAVTNVIDRLEKRRAVKRQSDPKDRRKVIVVLDIKAMRNAGNVYSSIGETFDKLARSYTTGELEFLVQYYKESIELTKQEIAKLAQKGRPIK